jgi:hypothetical protein
MERGRFAFLPVQLSVTVIPNPHIAERSVYEVSARDLESRFASTFLRWRQAKLDSGSCALAALDKALVRNDASVGNVLGKKSTFF